MVRVGNVFFLPCLPLENGFENATRRHRIVWWSKCLRRRVCERVSSSKELHYTIESRHVDRHVDQQRYESGTVRKLLNTNAN